ncbi:MAG: CoA-binding protein [Alicyclobacillaceae bacterium]|nr:CoA-binding protein [Alicyclobacillaceae bacterium]
MAVFQNPPQPELARILREARTIAVVGLSDNPERTSHAVSREMQRRGYRIIPVNPHVEQVLGERAYARVRDIPEPIDIVNVFRRSDALVEVVEDAVQTSAPVIWAQEGVYDERAWDIAQQHGRVLVMDLCIAVMHSLLIGAR